MKVCSKCNIEKDDSEFGRWKVCKRCLAQKQRERTKKERATPEGRIKHNRWAKEFYKRHREKCIAKMAETRKTSEYKAYMKAYRQRKKEIIYPQEVITKKRYHEKNRDAITDRYAINLLRTQGFGTVEEISKNANLIQLKKVQVLNKRIKMEILKKEKNGKKNV